MDNHDLEETNRAEKQALVRLIAKQAAGSNILRLFFFCRSVVAHAAAVNKERLALVYAEWNKVTTAQGLAKEPFVAGLKSLGVSDPVIEHTWMLWTDTAAPNIAYLEFGRALSAAVEGTLCDPRQV